MADVMDRRRPEPKIDACRVEGDIVKADHANESITTDQTDEISMFRLEQHGIDSAVLAELSFIRYSFIKPPQFADQL